MALTDLLNRTAQIGSATVTKSAFGGVVGSGNTAWSYGQAMTVKHTPANADVVLQFERMGFTVTDKFIFGTDPSAAPNVSRIRFDGKDYDVKSSQHHKQGSIEYWSVVAEFVKQ